MVTCGTLTVEQAEQPEANISVASCTLTPSSGSSVGQNTEVRVDYTLENTGGSDGTVTLGVLANGQEWESYSFTVPANGQNSSYEAFTPAAMGITGSMTVEISLSGADAATAGVMSADGGSVTGLSRRTSCASCGT